MVNNIMVACKLVVLLIPTSCCNFGIELIAILINNLVYCICIIILSLPLG